MAKANVKEIPAPGTLGDLADLLARVGELRRELARRETEMNDEIAAIRDRWQLQAAPRLADLAICEETLEQWCAAMRDELTDQGRRKYCDLATGRVGWRALPPKVSIRNLTQTLAAIKSLGQTQFLRVEESVDKEAMLAAPEAALKIPGVKIKSEGEKFYAEPREETIAGSEVRP